MAEGLTQSWWPQACEALAADPFLGARARSTPPIAFGRRGVFAGLARAIVGQQVRISMADAVWARLTEACGEDPGLWIALGEAGIASRGVSARKAAWIVALAREVMAGRLTDGLLEGMADDEAIAAMTAIPGIGRWTAQMHLIFGMRRPDVFPEGDLGVLRALGLGRSAREQRQAADRALAWRPYRSAAAWILWRGTTPL